jgi:hypothetical protein
VVQHARYRAPAESGQKLIAPPWDELPGLLAASADWRRTADMAILSQPLSQFASEARCELVAVASQYVRTYFDDAGEPVLSIDDPLVLTGHQPEMFHPGVWLKNLAAAALASRGGGLALNLIIDDDACRSTSIRVPAGTQKSPRLESVEFDAPGEDVPWEERRILDEGCWHSFGDRVRRATSPLLSQRMVDRWWELAVERGKATGLVGASLAQARHLAELAWGRHSLELPQSLMCQTAAFRRFACHVLADLPRFVEAYNSTLIDYRRHHGLRNHAQPVPNLAQRDGWLQAPFWVWSIDQPRRRSIYVRPMGGSLVMSDRRTFERSAPLEGMKDPTLADQLLAGWEREGLKLRSRALMTTMFARLAAGDMFIHGIGGAKYDEATDGICQRFFGAPPPPYATISGTLRLPVAQSAGKADAGRNARSRLRELAFHPERYLAEISTADPAAARLAAEKRRWVAVPKTAATAADRHRGIVAANAGLQPYLDELRAAAEADLSQAAELRRANRILNSREYAFCLFPCELLEQFLLDFPC